MSLLEALSAKAGQYSGRGLIASFKLIGRNFAKIEPKATTAGAVDYIPTLDDAGQTILRSNAAAQTLTLPADATTAFPIGTKLRVVQTGAGALTIQGAGGVTVNKLAAKTLVAAGANAVVHLTKTAANTWVASGDLT